MHSLLAGWRVSLHRTGADWPIVAAAWLSTLLAAVLLSTGPIYASAASEAGVRRALADAPPSATYVRASYYTAPEAADNADNAVRAALHQAIDALGGEVVRDAQSTESFSFAGRARGVVEERAVIGFAEGISDHARLIAGAWPTDDPGPEAPMPVAVLDTVASQLRLRVGVDVPLVVHHFDEATTLPMRVVGIFTISAPTDPYWQGDDQLAFGVVDHRTYLTYGPLLTTPARFFALPELTSVQARWRAFPNLARLTVAEAPRFKGRLNALPDVLNVAAGDELDVATGLPPILEAAERSLLVSGASVLLLMLQLAILAAYAIVLTAALLVDHRRIDTAMLRTRGADPWQLTLLSLGEALLLAVPAVLLGPWLAAAALLALNAAGPLADVGLTLAPRVTSQAYLAAAAAGAVCVALMVVPVLLGARRFAEAERDVSRAETRTFGQRMGLDVALLAISAIALWQLRLYGAPLTKSVRGSLGLDPLLVAAPAIGLLAGGVLALRILPAIALAAERGVARGRSLVAALGIQQLARRPLRYTRSALLLIIAVSTGVFALSYAATWSGSQRDQADFQSGAAVRAVPDHTVGAMPSWALPAAYAAYVPADRIAPVERLVDGLGFGADSGDVLGIDADTAADVVLFRADQSGTSLRTMMQALRSGRPAPQLPVLPDGTAYLRVLPRLELLRIQRFIFSLNAPEPRIERVDPEHLGDVQLGINAVVRDARGLLYAVDSAQVRFRPGEPITFGLTSAAPTNGEEMVGPLQLARLSVEVWLPEDTVASKGFVGLAGVSAAAQSSGPWTDVPLNDIGGWKASMTGFGGEGGLPADESGGVALALTGGGVQGTLFGQGLSGPPNDVQLMPASLATLSDAVPVIANRAFLAATDAAPSGTVAARLDGVPRTLSVAGVVDQFPGTTPGRPVVVIDERTLGLVRLQSTGAVRDAGEWWFGTTGGTSQQLAETLAAPPFKSGQVLTAAARARALSRDPVAVGILGALTLGFVAAALFAVVGLVVSAVVSARQRRTEFAVLRALGLSGGQLSGWLWLENGGVVAISLLAGTGLGLVIGWLVLPFVTVTQEGTAPVPAAIIQVPWDRILVLELIGAVALAAAVAIIGSVLRRLGVGAALRMGED